MARLLIATATALVFTTAQASDSIDLARYTLTGDFAIETLGGLGLEASAVTYARDRNSLFIVGDEGLGVMELSLTGQTLSHMRFSDWPSSTRHNDAEGLAYLGNGVLVVAEERLQDAFRFTYAPGGSTSLANAPWASISDFAYNNAGVEGLSYDPRTDTFVSVKQTNPREVRAGRLSFALGGGTSTMTPLFDASLLGLVGLSDIAVLAPVDALSGTPAADNLLVLSVDSSRLVETDRAGQVLSQLDLASISSQAIEGVTIDHRGTIYLVAEDSGTPNSRLFVLTPVSEPSHYALFMAGLGCIAWRLRRRSRAYSTMRIY